MANQIDWQKLIKGRYPSYTVEVNAFLDSLSISASSDVSIEHIYNAIKDEDYISEDLKLLYNEALNGTNGDVKARMRSRVGHFRRTLK